jgi:hypothetical protein
VERFCSIRVKWNAGDLDDQQVAHPGTFEEVVAILKRSATGMPTSTPTRWPTTLTGRVP